MNALRVVLAGLAAIILVSLGWRLSQPPARQVAGVPSTPSVRPQAPAPAPPVAPATPAPAAPAVVPPPSAAARAEAEALLDAAPDLARAFAALKAQFPAVAARSIDETADRLQVSGVKPSPDDIFAAAMKTLRQNSGVLAAKANPEALGAIFDSQAATLADLAQADPRICADYLYGGISPEYADFAAGHRALVAQAALASINAMAQGRAKPIDRVAPSTEDFKRIEDALLARGLSSDEIAALLDGKSLDPPLPDARLCDNARTYLDVLHAAAPDTRDRIYGLAAELLARS